MNTKWTRDEEILALYAYCHVPFNKASNSNPWIIKVANLIGRTPAAVKMKIGNFGAFDPQLKAKGIVGLTGTSKLDKEIWNEYYGHWDKLAYDAEVLIAQKENKSLENLLGLPKGEEAIVTVKRRINQSFFRDSVLASYNTTCCISGITNKEVLEACHIIAWSEDESLRTDPTNGLCMNALFHKAYDKLLVSITPDYILKICDEFMNTPTVEATSSYLKSLHNHKIILPTRFLPNPENLEAHYARYKAER